MKNIEYSSILPLVIKNYKDRVQYVSQLYTYIQLFIKYFTSN